MALLKTITIPVEQRKKTTLARNLYYDALEIHDNRVVGYLDGKQKMTWYYKDYNGIDLIGANMNSQFAQVVFLTGINSKNRAVGIDITMSQNINAMNDTNRILFCSGMFNFKKTNAFAENVASSVKAAFENYRNSFDAESQKQMLSPADEIKKYKDLLDSGIISQEEFESKKKQLLNI